MLLSSSNWDLLELSFVAGDGGVSEVVGGGWCEIKEFRRVGRGVDDVLEVRWLDILYKLEGESLVLLSSSNWDLR